jgi:T5SS/PEP-CTERM-associated repeat protein/autotransporter-associated beta strand protein
MANPGNVVVAKGFTRAAALSGASLLALLASGVAAPEKAAAQAVPGDPQCPVVAGIVTCSGNIPNGVNVPAAGDRNGLTVENLTADIVTTTQHAIRFAAGTPTTTIVVSDPDNAIRVTTTTPDTNGQDVNVSAILATATGNTSFSLTSDIDIFGRTICPRESCFADPSRQATGITVRGSGGSFAIENLGNISIDTDEDATFSRAAAIVADVFGADLVSIRNAGDITVRTGGGIVATADNDRIEIVNDGTITVNEDDPFDVSTDGAISLQFESSQYYSDGFSRPDVPEVVDFTYSIINNGDITTTTVDDLGFNPGIIVSHSYIEQLEVGGAGYSAGRQDGEIVNNGTIGGNYGGIYIDQNGDVTITNNGRMEGVLGVSVQQVILDIPAPGGAPLTRVVNSATGTIEVVDISDFGISTGIDVNGGIIEIENAGLIDVDGENAVGVYLAGSSASSVRRPIQLVTVENEGDVLVSGTDAIGLYVARAHPESANRAPDQHTVIGNSGTIEALGDGADAINVRNSTSAADTSLANIGTTEIDLSASSIVRGGSGDGTAIRIEAGDAHSIENAGLITSTSGSAIVAGSGKETLDNSGRIEGSVGLGENDDRIDALAGGVITGAVDGGLGADTIGFGVASGSSAFTSRFEGAVSGIERLEKTGAGTLTLATAAADTAFLIGGTLATSGSLGAMDVAASAGTVLSATGSLGDVTLGGNAVLSAGGTGVGAVTLASLSLAQESILRFDLGEAGVAGGANNDLVTVTGNLTLDGTLNVNARPGFGDGVYRLIDYGGTLTDNGLALGSIPTGDYEVQTAVEGQVNLVAGNTADLSIQFWDGTGAANDGTIAGGAGTWNAEAINWTDANGTLNHAWGGQFAVFQNAGGTVTVAGPQSITGMQFMDNGYDLVAGTDGSLVLGAEETVVRVDADVSANVAVDLTGAGMLVKREGGALILSGDNSYTGGTVVREGELQFAGGDTIGSSMMVAPEAGDEASLVVTGADTALTLDKLEIGFDGTATATISGGAEVTADRFSLGNRVSMHPDFSIFDYASGSGTLTITGAGSLLETVSEFNVGTKGTGTLIVTDGGTLRSTYGMVGREGDTFISETFIPAVGAVTVTGEGSSWISEGGMVLGNAGGQGSLTVADGGLVQTASVTIGSGGILPAGVDDIIKSDGTVTVTGAGSLLDVAGTVRVGTFNGRGQLIVADGGTVSADLITIAKDEFTTGIDGTEVGLLAIGGGVDADGDPLAAAAPGTLDVPTVDLGQHLGTADLLFNHTGADYVFDPAVIGFGTITHAAGDTDLAGDSAEFTGTTNVTGGTLLVSGSLGGAVNVDGSTLMVSGTVGGTVTVGEDGLLGGTGAIGGLVLEGTLSPGFSPGTITIDGDATFAEGSVLEIELLANGGGDFIDISGTATIEGGTVEIGLLDPETSYVGGTTYRFIDAAGGLTGTFDGLIENSAFLDFALGYDATGVFTTVEQVLTFPDVAFTFNQVEAAEALADFDQTGGSDALVVYNALLMLDGDAARAAFDAASGEIHAANLASATRRSGGIAERLIARGTTASGEGWGVWGSLIGEDGHVEGDGNGERFSRNAVGGEFGIDYGGPDDGWAAGLGFGYQDGDTHLPGRRSSADYSGWHIGTYARLGSGGAGFTLWAAAAYADGNSDVSRTVAIGALNRTVTSRVDLSGWSLGAEARYGIAVGGDWAVGAQARIVHAEGKLGSFSESGAGSLDLSGGTGNDDRRTRYGAGGFLHWAGENGSFDAGLAWMTGKQDPAEIGLAMAGAPGSPYRVRAARGDGDAAQATLAASVELGGGWTLGANALGAFGSREEQLQGSVTVGWKF